ncbi:MAG: hypothetical protein IKH20_07440 [Clostridiales bacterium]|nr:hypothetical protein [Clostridiales bacterium]
MPRKEINTTAAAALSTGYICLHRAFLFLMWWVKEIFLQKCQMSRWSLRYYKKVVKPQIHSYMGSVFEEMCRYYTLEKGIKGA